MLKTGPKSLILLLRIISDLLLILNILALIGLPWLLTALLTSPELLAQLSPGTGIIPTAGYPAVTSRTDMPPSSYPFYLAFLYVAGLATAWILLEGHLILRRLERNEPFAAGQARSFRRMSVACGLLAGCFGIKVLVYNTFLTMFCAAVFSILILITQIMAEVFRQAYLVKTENELTI